MNNTNNPPYVSLDLDEEEALFVVELIAQNAAQLEHDLYVLGSMSSTDPKAKHRSVLTMAVINNITGCDVLFEKLNKANSIANKYDEHKDKCKRALMRQNTNYAEYRAKVEAHENDG